MNHSHEMVSKTVKKAGAGINLDNLAVVILILNFLVPFFSERLKQLMTINVAFCWTFVINTENYS